MIKAFLLLTLALSLNANASCVGIGEAEVIGFVAKINQGPKTCRVFLTSNVTIWNSIMCPLDEARLADEGAETSQCNLKVGDQVSGIFVDNGSFIYIENN